MLRFSISLFTCFVFSALTLLANGNWELAKDKEDIKVFTQFVEGHPLKDFKGITTIKTSLDAVTKFLVDIENYTDWMPDCKESSYIRKVSDTEYYQYVITAAPWPVSDRDTATKCVVNKNSETEVIINITGIPDLIDQKKGMVRVPIVNSYWKLTDLGNNTVEVEYFAHSDPGGKLPDWLVNSAVVNTPFNTLKNLREALEN